MGGKIPSFIRDEGLQECQQECQQKCIRSNNHRNYVNEYDFLKQIFNEDQEVYNKWQKVNFNFTNASPADKDEITAIKKRNYRRRCYKQPLAGDDKAEYSARLKDGNWVAYKNNIPDCPPEA